ncbi:ribosomal protein S6 kinase delta-1 [Anopheles marshallii]|uniref:ribosomal protein S6 kinase delta-1 n=1 Tax=Anopheles marshallii TaxID=1521116 RepID=UPI00237C0EF6|nr:ribosomal protein S6 kinase delta-1 [Anopheles marshallii]
MLLVGRRKTETWVHSFSVGNETRKYKGFTIYRITSIVFPRSHPEGLTRVTLWKRFSEVKKLYKELVRRHRERHLGGTVPVLAEHSYFKRFDPAVIEERKRYILQLLEFAGQEPLLYRSHAFLNFFTRGIVPEKDSQEENVHECADCAEKKNGTSNGRGNIETIRKHLGIGHSDELSLVDPSRDGQEGPGTDGSCTSGGEEADEDDTNDAIRDSDSGTMLPPLPLASSGSLMDSMISETASSISETEQRPAARENMTTEEPPVDYLVAAAMIFSKAVEAEANGEYQRAFEQYKAGIDRLLSGAKDDANITRRKIAKEKSCKYVVKAEEIYERFLEETVGSHPDEQMMGPLAYDDPSSPIQLLERPLNYLSRYKVVKVIGTVMQVQDVTDKKFYIMKSIRRPPPAGLPFSSAAVFPQDVPYMVPLIAYFQATDGGIFLLLRLVCAGKLWDFIRSYRKPESYCPSPEEPVKNEDNDRKPIVPVATTETTVGENVALKEPNCSAYDSGFLDLVNEYSNGAESSVIDGNSPNLGDRNDETDEVALEAQPDEEIEQDGIKQEEQEIIIPSFDALSKDMDVRELLSCSQRLLKAVTQTLEESGEPSNNAAQSVPVLKEMSASSCEKQQEQISKSQSSQLGLARLSSISETMVNELTPDLLPEGSVRRWISELVIAVDSLHFNGIVCGDLTMDNLLLGPEGQLMLTYFHRRGESYFCQSGDAHPALKQTAIRELYVAPERPLEPKSDFWSIGVIMFEMLTKRKFVSCHPSGVFCYHEVQYPEGMELSLEARELLEGLLQPDIERRLDFKQIIASTFFRTVDWSEVKRHGATMELT